MRAFDEEARAAYPQSCITCQNDPEARKRWGCDEPLTDEQWEENQARSDGSALAFSPCFRCDGKDDKCGLCKGSNQWRLHRCPNACVDRWHEGVCTVVALWQDGVLPRAGGWMDQPAISVHAGRIVQTELRRIQERQAEAARARAERR